MTKHANKFTAEVLLSAPRRSSATPNSDGTLALFTVSTYSFDTHSRTAEIRVLDTKTGQSRVLCSDSNASEPTWVGDKNLVLWIQSGEKGASILMLADADLPSDRPQVVGTIDGPIANLKIARLNATEYAIALTGLSTPAGDLYNPEKAKKPFSSGRIYTSGYVRHWDTYVTENTNAIFYGLLTKQGTVYRGAPPGLVNALLGNKSVRLESPVPTFGGSGDFDISKNGIVFVARDPKIDPATHTKSDLYYLPLKTFQEAEAPLPLKVKTGNLRGYSASPVFSPNAKSVAFTLMQNDVYESDKPRILLLSDIEDLTNVQEFFETKDGEGAWDLKPGSLLWSPDGTQLFVIAEDRGKERLWKFPASPRHATSLPEQVSTPGSISDVKILAKNGSKLLVSSSSYVESSLFSIIDAADSTQHREISSSAKGGKSFGLHQSQVDEIWFPSTDGTYKVHAFVVKPSFFDKTKKYPLAYLIHGGPQAGWTESWSTRWNPAIFAEQGYVAVAVNFTGSSGYGMKFQNAIRNNWGGRPYQDLVAGFDYIEKNLEYVDTSRAVALGASYGGFMVNWIQGHELGRRFKCLVTHDGVFSTLNQYASEEIFFPLHDFGGPIWENREGYEKWDPSRHIGNWQTPHFIIHNELDYRLPISEGLAPFNVLLGKGIPTKFLTFPDENHWVVKPENSLVWHREVLDWINKWSGIEDDQFRIGTRE